MRLSGKCKTPGCAYEVFADRHGLAVRVSTSRPLDTLSDEQITALAKSAVKLIEREIAQATVMDFMQAADRQDDGT